MPMGSRAYVVRDACVGADTSEVTQIYPPYTLKGLGLGRRPLP
jgi:hypothetical protein